jgi:hypothetical protein
MGNSTTMRVLKERAKARKSPASAAEKLLDALDDRPNEWLTIEQLTVTAWNKYPLAFGLRGYETQHPCTNRVKVTLYGARGLLAQGLLAKDDSGRISMRR